VFDNFSFPDIYSDILLLSKRRRVHIGFPVQQQSDKVAACIRTCELTFPFRGFKRGACLGETPPLDSDVEIDERLDNKVDGILVPGATGLPARLPVFPPPFPSGPPPNAGLPAREAVVDDWLSRNLIFFFVPPSDISVTSPSLVGPPEIGLGFGGAD
jgi:hypothetical protein